MRKVKLKRCRCCPMLIEALEQIASDCSVVSELDIVTKAESRTWRSVGAKAKGAVAAWNRRVGKGK